MAKTQRRRRYAAPIGVLFMLLAAIGLITIVVGSVRLTLRALDNTPELNKIKEVVRPVVMWDPVPFESPEEIDPVQLLYFSMWAAIMEKGGNFAIDEESQSSVISASDLDVAAARLFGQEVPLEHQTFGEYDTTYYYDENEEAGNRYLVPTVTLYVYSPTVDSIEKVGDLYYARIGYLAPSGAYTINYQGDLSDPEPEKYMIYVLRKAGSSYELVAVRYDDEYYQLYAYDDETE